MRIVKLLAIALWLACCCSLAQSAPVPTREKLEDFDSTPTTWNSYKNRPYNRSESWPNMDYGWSSGNNLASEDCAPGELGGTISREGISWFADSVCSGTTPLNDETVLIASGYSKFTYTGGNACFGWFNSDSYKNGGYSVPNQFIGWRQNGNTIISAVGSTGSSFVNGTPTLNISLNTPFFWQLIYSPIGSSSGTIKLVVNGTTSTVTLDSTQRGALSAFDRFGMVAQNNGTQKSTVYHDNVIYSVVSSFPTPHSQALAHFDVECFDSSIYCYGNKNLDSHTSVSITQDYKWQDPVTSIGHNAAGCIGGFFANAIGTSYYGYKYSEPLHFTTDKLRSEGYLMVPPVSGENLYFGWTSTKSNSWRDPSTIGFRISKESNHVKVRIDTATKNYRGSGGIELTTFTADSQWRHYVLEYDPGEDSDPGTVTITLDKCYFNGAYNPDGGTWAFNLSNGRKDMDADIDLFGMWNYKLAAKDDSALEAYLDDVKNTVNNTSDTSTYSNPNDNSSWFGNFTNDPSSNDWVGRNNDFTAKDYIIRPHHQFGWAQDLMYLDGLNGYSPMYTIPETERYCMGGIIYLATQGRFDYTYEYANLEDEEPTTITGPEITLPINSDVKRACYGISLGDTSTTTLNTRDHHMLVTGKIKLDFANADAGELIGWYDSATATSTDESTHSYRIAIFHDFPGTEDSTQNPYAGWTVPDKFMGVRITGSSNTGYHIMPGYKSPFADTEYTSEPDSTPQPPRIYQDGQWHEFYLEYNPMVGDWDTTAQTYGGQLKFQLDSDGVPYTFNLLPGEKSDDYDTSDGFKFDRFGLLTMRKGGGRGQAVYLDKLTYTVAP